MSIDFVNTTLSSMSHVTYGKCGGVQYDYCVLVCEIDHPRRLVAGTSHLVAMVSIW